MEYNQVTKVIIIKKFYLNKMFYLKIKKNTIPRLLKLYLYMDKKKNIYKKKNKQTKCVFCIYSKPFNQIYICVYFLIQNLIFKTKRLILLKSRI